MDTKTILIIEDEEMLVRYLGKALEKAGFAVVSAGSAPEGSRMADEHAPDLILLDILIPEGGGEALLSELKSSEKTKGIPVVVMTNLTNAGTKERCEALGCADFIVKADYRLDRLVEKVKELLTAHVK